MFKCDICGRDFNSKHSLGGHMSSHNRGEKYSKLRETISSKKRKERSLGPHDCKFCGKNFKSGPSLGAHTVSCKSNPNYFELLDKRNSSKKGRALSDSHKIAISESMKSAHNEGRAWNIGRSRWNNTPSYPEEFFMQVIENEFSDKKYTREYAIGVYSIDFAWVHKKIAIEIDGDQHQRFQEYLERDQRKDSYLISNGWKILRIPWKDLYNSPKEYIKIAATFVGD